MARISGVDLPPSKRVEIGLTYIFGIGRSRALELLSKVRIDGATKVKDLSEPEIDKIRGLLTNYSVEGDLRREVGMNIKRLMDLGTYRGIRHRRGLPVRGQRSRTNARTRKGPRRMVRK